MIDYAAIAAAGGFGKGTPRAARRLKRQRDESAEIKACRPCPQCGEPIPEDGRYQRQFCSNACAYMSRGLARRTFKEKACPVCGKTTRGPRLTCSAACGYRFRKLRLRRQKTCPVCKKLFWPVRRRGGTIPQTHCSRTCFHIAVAVREALVRVVCEQCGREFRRTRAAVRRVKHVFCNRVCRSRFARGENHSQWRGGANGYRGTRWQVLAEAIRVRDGRRCRRCGKSEAEQGRKLDVDHIRPWRSFTNKDDANNPSNLVSLCKHCHRVKTTTVESAWLKGDVLGMMAYERAIGTSPKEAA